MTHQTINKLTLIALGAVALTACSDTNADEPQATTTGNEIRFAANTEFNSRANNDVTTNNLTQFNVYAYTGTGSDVVTFMDNVKVTKGAANTWTYSPVKYWPAEDVSFYAFAPESWVGSDGPLKPVKYSSYYADEDLIYAVSPNLNGNRTQPNAQVVFNFRHALSKVTLLLSSSNADLKVDVTNAALAHLKSSGDFTFPSASTTGAPTDQSVGTWSNLADNAVFLLYSSQRPDEVMTLSATPTDVVDASGGSARYFIPQTLPWQSNGGLSDTYISLTCVIYDAATGVKLWPNANTPAENILEGSTLGVGVLKFPLSTSTFTQWQPGYHYVYNVVINGNSDMGTIEFGNPTVDTYVDVETTYE